MTKVQVLHILDQLPDEFEPEELIERLLFVERLEQRLRQADEREGVSFEEARARFMPQQPIQHAA